MFKVECLGCQAPYQVDERRVPATGLQMRCPKCGTSFKVESPEALGVEVQPEPVVEAPVGFSPMTSPIEVRSPSALGRDALSRTMIGVSSTATPAARAPFRMPRPGENTALDARQVNKAPEDASSTGFEEHELPPVLVGGPVATLEQPLGELEEGPGLIGQPDDLTIESEKSEPVPESLAAPSQPLSLSELPVPVARAADPPEDQDLPAVAGAPKEYVGLPGLALEDDLPAAKRPASVNFEAMTELPALPLRPGRPPPRRKKGVIALPAVAGASAEPVGDDEDLPAARSYDLLGAVAESADLPVAVESDAGAPLPALPSVGLPSAMEGPVGLGDLPSVLGGGNIQRDLPSVLGGGATEVELPSVLGAGAEGGNLPSPAAVALPVVAATGQAEFGQVALPDMKAGLPLVQAALPEVQVTLPEVQAVLPEVQATLPEVQAVLPEVQAVLPQVQGVLPEISPSFSDAVDGPHFGDVASAFADPLDPSSLEAGSTDDSFSASAEFSFGDTGPGEVSNFSFPPDEEPFGGAETESGPDPFATAAFDAEGELDELADSSGMEASFPMEPDGDSLEAAGAAGYGEVSIAGDHETPLETGLDTDLDTADDMEFSAVPQESEDGVGTYDPSSADGEAPGATLELAAERERPARRLERRVAIAVALGLGIVGGGAMSLKPDLGPFGIYYVLDEVHRSENERVLSSLRTQAQASLDNDTLEAARAAIARAETAAQRAPRFTPLKAHLATLLHMTALRFGPLAEIEAAGKAALRELDLTEGRYPLAKVSAEAAQADPSAAAKLASMSGSPEAQSLALEAFLQADNPQAAIDVLAKSGAESSARAQFVAARAQLAQGNWKQASQSAAKVLELNPDHVGALIVRLDVRRQVSGVDSDKPPAAEGAGLSLAGLTKQLELALPTASPAERVMAHEVRGDIHLKYGRVGLAQEQFESALALQRNSPRALVGLGKTLVLVDRNAEALARFEAAVVARPDSLKAQLGVVQTQLALEHLGKAKALIEKLLKKHPKNAEIVYWQGQSEQALENSETALIAYRGAIELANRSPSSMRYYLALAELEARVGQAVRATKTLAEAKAKLPPNSLLFHAMGRAAMQEGKYGVALANFNDAINIDSEDTRARFLRAVALARLKRFDEALKAFDVVGHSDEAFPGLAMERGRLFEISGRNAQALEQYEVAYSKAPDDEDLKLRLGCARVVEGQAEKALPLLVEIVKARSRSAEAHYCLGRAHFERQNFAPALRLLTRAVRLDDSQAIYYLYEGWVANDVGKTAQASASLTRALALDNGLGDAYWLRGRLGRKQGAVKDAVRDLRRALKLSPDRVEVLADLAMAFADLGQRKRAVATWKLATERRPNQATWRYRYGKLLSSGGQRKRAIVQLEKALKLAQPKLSAAGLQGQATQAWIPQAHYLVARALGKTQRAVTHWQAFLSATTEDNPYRKEAQKALRSLGATWESP